MNINHVTVVGRVTADPELRSTNGGQPVTRVGIATNRTWTDKTGQKQEEVEFHNVVIFGRQAEIAAQFAQKGSHLGVEGRLRTRVWADKGGTEHKTTEIICEELHLGPKPTGTATPPAKKDRIRGEGGDESASTLIPLLDESGEIKTEDIPF